jgi:hypothetical protein
MDALIKILLVGVGVIVFLWFLLSLLSKDEGKQKKAGKGGRGLFKKREDPIAVIVKEVNEARDEIGLPRLPIETIADAFRTMSPELLTKVELHIGPVAKEIIAGWTSQTLERIGKQNEDLARFTIEQNRGLLEFIGLRAAGKIAIKNLDTALDAVDALADVLAKHGEEEAEEVRCLGRRRVYCLVWEDYLSKLPGAQKYPELVEPAFQEIRQLLPEHEVKSQGENVGVAIQGEVVDVGFGSNGDGQAEREYSR